MIGAPASTLPRQRVSDDLTPGLVGTSVLLVTVPVFLQAPWVRFAPASSALFTLVLVAIGLGLERRGEPELRHLGLLLVGFSGSWLAGSFFWGWARLHPLWHLPIEAFALPLALAGLGGRWRLACGFYLGSLIGTAATDAAIAATGLMPLWPEALAAPAGEALLVLHAAGLQVLQPACLALVAGFAALLLVAGRWLGQQGELGQVVGATLITTLAVDGLFLLLALVAPTFTGLI